MEEEKKKLYNPFIDEMEEVDLKINRYCISNQLHGLRKMNHLTQEELAILSGLSVTTIARIENGENVLLENVAKYARACGYELSIRKMDGRS